MRIMGSKSNQKTGGGNRFFSRRTVNDVRSLVGSWDYIGNEKMLWQGRDLCLPRDGRQVSKQCFCRTSDQQSR